jgi:intracellular sulfur oxidation DsrE/DsrF family protein
VNTVFHCSTTDSLSITDAKVSNLLGDETVEIDAVAVVVDSPTVIDAAAGSHRETVAAILDAGAEFCVCSNALRGATSSLADLPDGTEKVSSGVGELTRRQNRGAAYIRL